MNMFKPTKVTNVKEYLKSVPADQREALIFVHNFILKTVPKLKSHFAYNMLGYGSFLYKNNKKEIVEWPVISLASQKNYISIYVCALDGKQYLAEKYSKKLGRVSVGKSCIRFRKLEDLNLPVLKKVLKEAAMNPGLVSAKKGQ